MKTKHKTTEELPGAPSPSTGSEEKFGRLFGIIESGVAILSLEGRGPRYVIADLNKAGERILEFTREDAIGRNPLDFFQFPETVAMPELMHRVQTTGHHEGMLCRGNRKRTISLPLKITFYRSSPTQIIAVFDENENSPQAELVVPEADDFMTVLFALSHLMIVKLDTNFNYVRVSTAYAGANGRSPEFYIGRNFFDLYPDRGDAGFFRSVIERGEPVSCFVRRHRPLSNPNGAEAFRNWDIFPLKDGTGEVKELLVCMFDITDYYKTAMLLGESEERFNSFFSEAPAGLGIVDENLRYLKVNQTYADLNGLTIDDHIGRPLSEVVPDIAPKIIPILQRVIDTGVPVVNFEYSGKRSGHFELAGGTGHWVISAFPLHWSNKKGIGYILIDITSLRQAEEKLKKSETLLQSVFDGLSIPVVVMEKDRSVRYCNRAARDYYGMEGEEALGNLCYIGLKKESVPCAGCGVWEAIPKGIPVTIERMGLMNPDLIEIVRTYPWVGAAGELTGAIMTISDETQTRLLERQIIQNQKLASIGLLVSGIAHEISNANNFVTFNIPLLRQYFKAIFPFVETHALSHSNFELFGMSLEAFCKDFSGLVENLEYGSERIKATVSALKDFSRIRTEEKREWTRIEEVASKVVAICRSELINRVKSFEVDIPPALPPMLLDAKALEQVLVNLVVNAAHAADKEDSWVRLSLSESPKGGGITIELNDNGTGMDPKTRERIFDPFFTTKGPGAGTGLGLYICRNLIEGLGGKINVRSDPGQGTSFKVILPLMQNICPEEGGCGGNALHVGVDDTSGTGSAIRVTGLNRLRKEC